MRAESETKEAIEYKKLGLADYQAIELFKNTTSKKVNNFNDLNTSNKFKFILIRLKYYLSI